MYINKDNTLAALSPGVIFQKYDERKDKTKKEDLCIKILEFKKQKLRKKLWNNVVNANRESSDSVAYKSGINMCYTNDVTEISAPNTTHRSHWTINSLNTNRDYSAKCVDRHRVRVVRKYFIF